MSRREVVVCGAGAAGLMAAIRAASAGLDVLLLEKNAKAGVKILASGGGRCNLTTTREGKALERSFPANQRSFLRHALRAFPPAKLRRFFADLGVGTHEEEWEKIFPDAGRASVVVQALLRALDASGAELRLRSPLRGIRREDDGFLVATEGGSVAARRVVLAVGGRSYPKTGTTGDGYAIARSLGHSVTPLVPHLVGLEVADPSLRNLAGLTLEEVRLHLVDAEGRRRHTVERPLLFTHRGVSGPGPMNVAGDVASGAASVIEVELAPGRPFEELDRELVEAARRWPKRRVAGLLQTYVPERLALVLCERVGLDVGSPAARLEREARRALVHGLRAFRLEISGTQGWDRAEVTRGGIARTEVDPRTMESRIVPGLYLVGEILDVDGPIGGFNFQAAFATAWLAGEALAGEAGAADALRE